MKIVRTIAERVENTRGHHDARRKPDQPCAMEQSRLDRAQFFQNCRRMNSQSRVGAQQRPAQEGLLLGRTRQQDNGIEHKDRVAPDHAYVADKVWLGIVVAKRLAILVAKTLRIVVFKALRAGHAAVCPRLSWLIFPPDHRQLAAALELRLLDLGGMRHALLPEILLEIVGRHV